MTEAEALRGIRSALKQRERAEQAQRAARATLAERVRAAQEAGVSVTRIAQEAGLLGRAFTTCWRTGDLFNEPVEVAARRHGDFVTRSGQLLLRLPLCRYRGEAIAWERHH